jgi:very-short-patch-repair endonuclease
MRHAMTSGEAALWSCLKGKQLGVAFRRQVPLAGRFIADFLAPSVRLVVEVDGGWHHARAVADTRRDRLLARLGHRVLRLDDALVLGNLEAAVARVREALCAGS